MHTYPKYRTTFISISSLWNRCGNAGIYLKKHIFVFVTFFQYLPYQHLLLNNHQHWKTPELKDSHHWGLSLRYMDIIWLFVSECFNRETKGTTCSFKLRDIINIVTSNEWVDNIHIYAERQWTIKFIKLCIEALDVLSTTITESIIGILLPYKWWANGWITFITKEKQPVRVFYEKRCS